MIDDADQSPVEDQTRVNTGQSTRWERPQAGQVKVNFNAAFSDSHGTEYGLVVRNDHGSLLFAACHKPLNQLNPTLAEATCFRWAIQLCASWGLDNITFETDCNVLTKMWH